jgi:hypothetical protein
VDRLSERLRKMVARHDTDGTRQFVRSHQPAV